MVLQGLAQHQRRFEQLPAQVVLQGQADCSGQIVRPAIESGAVAGDRSFAICAALEADDDMDPARFGG